MNIKKYMIISILALLASMPIMLIGVFLGIVAILIVGSVGMFVAGMSTLTFIVMAIYRKSKNKGPNIIVIKAKPGNVLIDCEKKNIKYKNIKIDISEIISYELIDNSQKALKSGFGEAVVGGILFGGAGAMAGAYAGKGEKLKEKCKMLIKTKNVLNTGVVFNLSLDNGFRLYEAIDLLAKENKKKTSCSGNANT